MTAIIDAYDTVILDLDGVLYRGSHAIPGAADVVVAIRERGVRPVFVTNNASRTPTQVCAHLASVGVAATPDEVETSALVTAEHLARRGIRRALVVGQDGLLEALAERGVAAVALADDPEAVVVGLDRGVTYERLRDAGLAIQRGAAFIAANPDTTFPAEDGNWPGAGAIAAAIAAASDCQPEVMGKPAAPIFVAALERSRGSRPLVVGDRLDTDVAGAIALGWDSFLVLTGVTTREALEHADVRPSYVAEDLGELVRDQSGGRGSAGPRRAPKST